MFGFSYSTIDSEFQNYCLNSIVINFIHLLFDGKYLAFDEINLTFNNNYKVFDGVL
jgi:hypothetical protein